ncbi:hypothetical protein DFH11DRAFT_1637426 [Phellopilus nigrolimitatus]|nr:hypothetical protein DFH11DRAFT_1637426 [Phellopilus nigrolimitatus]
MAITHALAMFNVAKTYALGLFTGENAARSVLPFIPRPLRVLLVLLLVLNARSLPFLWHLRVFRPLLYIRLKWLSLSLGSRHTKQAWLDSLSPIAVSPFALRSSYSTWASLDESDYNMHLSNSSYAKVLDMLRLKFALQHFATVFRDGCWIALGSTHLRFIREIPIGAKYEIRMYIGSWDEKWAYIIARYVSKKHSKSSSSSSRGRLQDTADALSSAAFIPSLHTPASPDTPFTSGVNTPNPQLIQSKEEFDALWAEAPGETLHALAINELVFKQGRRTVPPAVTLAAAGCGVDDKAWERAKMLRGESESAKVDADANGVSKDEGGAKVTERETMSALLAGGWRTVPTGERWWEDTLAPFEAERVRRLGVLRRIRDGMECAGGM